VDPVHGSVVAQGVKGGFECLFAGTLAQFTPLSSPSPPQAPVNVRAAVVEFPDERIGLLVTEVRAHEHVRRIRSVCDILDRHIDTLGQCRSHRAACSVSSASRQRNGVVSDQERLGSSWEFGHRSTPWLFSFSSGTQINQGCRTNFVLSRRESHRGSPCVVDRHDLRVFEFGEDRN